MARKIEISRANVSSSREALKQCKVLLQSKRDDVRRLWLDWCEQKSFYASLTNLKRINNASEIVKQMCSDKSYLEAAELIADCTNQLHTEFVELGALKDFGTILNVIKIKLEQDLFDELNYQFYDSVTKSVLETGGIGLVTANSSMIGKRRLFKTDMSFGEIGSKTTTNSLGSNVDDPAPAQLTSEQMIEIIVAAAAKLTSSEQLTSVNIIEKLVEDVNHELCNRLINMVNLTSTHVVESNLINRSSVLGIENNPKFLCQLIELSFEQFKCMARLYRHFIECAISKLVTFGAVTRYQWSHVWVCIQNVLMQLLEEYLDIKQLNQTQSSTDPQEKIDINAFFVRKRLINLAFGSESSSTIANNDSGADTDEKDNHRVFTFKGFS